MNWRLHAHTLTHLLELGHTINVQTRQRDGCYGAMMILYYERALTSIDDDESGAPVINGCCMLVVLPLSPPCTFFFL
jgi:hypothetical protein